MIYGMPARELPEGWTPLEAVVVVKCLNEEGEVCLATRNTEGLYPWDRLGMLSAAIMTEEDYLRQGYEGEND